MSQITQPKPIMTDEPGKDPTLADLLRVMDKMSTDIDERFDKIEATMATKVDLVAAVQRIDKIEVKVNHIETQMVTKSYLDEKLYDLKGDLIVIARKEDRKVNSVVNLLRQKNIFSAQEAAEVLSAAVFSEGWSAVSRIRRQSR